MSEWHAQVVAHMRDSKRTGCTFEAAWMAAMLEYPPRGRNVDYRETLFPDGDEGGCTLYAFFKEACRVAWHGEQPRLRHFTLEMLAPAEEEFDYRSVVAA